jgi:threonine synthase
MWRYADTLPVDPPDDLRLAAGGTPLFRARQLDAYAGCAVWLKDETENPTGSFKDRGTAVGVTAAITRGRRAIATVSQRCKEEAHGFRRGRNPTRLEPIHER